MRKVDWKQTAVARCFSGDIVRENPCFFFFSSCHAEKQTDVFADEGRRLCDVSLAMSSFNLQRALKHSWVPPVGGRSVFGGWRGKVGGRADIRPKRGQARHVFGAVTWVDATLELEQASRSPSLQLPPKAPCGSTSEIPHSGSSLLHAEQPVPSAADRSRPGPGWTMDD